jgi:Tfp pilus assembly protein PilX
MKTDHNTQHHRNGRARSRNGSRGVALVTTLLLLMLMVAMTLGMTIAVTSDTLINKYYRNARSSFYAADSGVNTARQYMINYLGTNAVANGTNFSSTGAPPLSSTDATNALSGVLSTYGSATSILGGPGANSWPSKFQIVSSQSGTLGTTLSTTPTCTPTYTGTATNAGPYNCTTNLPTCTGTCTGFAVTDFQYIFPYTITAIGQSLANEQQIVEDAGNITLNVHVAPAGGTTTSFAAFGTFLNSYPECSTPFAPGTLTGPFFTNGAWTFTNSGSYTFTGKVGSVSSTFGWDGNSGCNDSATYPQPGFSTTFQSSVNLGATALPLPVNDFNQKEAVVDGVGNTWTQSNLTTAQQDSLMNAALKTYNGTAYPAAGTTNPGVYMAYSSTTVGGVTTRTMTGGGIYVESSASSVELSTANPTIGGTVHSQQVFTIVQGTTTTTITEDLTSDTTTMASKTGSGATTTTTINGLPEDDVTGTPSPATMLYVDGTIGNNNNTGLSGPGQGVAAIQNGAAITITASGNIDVTGDILYKTEPVTETQNQIPGDPADTLIPGNNSGQVLGLFTATGNIAEYNQQSNGNIEIDASLAMISQGGSGGWVNNGNAINTLTLVGGRVASQAMVCNCNSRNIYFDQRFAQGNFAPPWYPSTTVTPTATDTVTSVVSTVQRTQWLAVY